MLEGRGKVDMSSLKAVVVDEADVFFSDQRNKDELMRLHNLIADRIKSRATQYIMFSATYPEKVYEQVGSLVDEA